MLEAHVAFKISTSVFFFSTVFADLFNPYHIFSSPSSTFLDTPPIFLYLSYSTLIGARSLLRRYTRPFRLYKRSVQQAHTSPLVYPPGPHPAPPGPTLPSCLRLTLPATPPPTCPTLSTGSPLHPHQALPYSPFPHLDPPGPPPSAAGVTAKWELCERGVIAG